MHDIRLIRENPAAFDAGLARRGLEPLSAAILTADASVRALQTEVQASLARRNEASKLIGQAMAEGDKDKAEALKAEVATLKTSLPEKENAEREQLAALQDTLAALPNLPAADVPEGEDEDGNVEIARWGTPRTFDFTAQEHADFAPALGLDFETAAKMSGARFAFLRGQMARLERALGQFMIDRQTIDAGYTECATPLMVHDDAAFGTTQLPKFERDLFQTDLSLDPFELYEFKRRAHADWAKKIGMDVNEAPSVVEPDVWNMLPSPSSRRWLISTSEMSLTNAVREDILPEADLPIRMTALTPCFRSEAGSAGQGYARLYPPASILEGRAGVDRPSGGQRCRAGAQDARRRGDSRGARAALSQDAAVRRRHGLCRPQDL